MPHVKGGGTRLDGGVMLSFSTPIFHFGERKHAVAAVRSDYLREINAIEAVVDRITLDESDTWTNLCSTYDRANTAQRNLAIAQENLVISTYSYREGLATILDVLQAQLSWLQTYTNTITAQYDYAVAVAAYDYVTCK
jgi:outer membrane protein TolC